VTWSELVRSKLYTWHFEDFLPRVLASHDLPQLAGILAPRPVWLLNSLDAMKSLADKNDVRHTYRWTTETYSKARAGKQFFTGVYANTSELPDIVTGWAKMTF
jgi:hypothetical protein